MYLPKWHDIYDQSEVIFINWRFLVSTMVLKGGRLVSQPRCNNYAHTGNTNHEQMKYQSQEYSAFQEYTINTTK